MQRHEFSFELDAPPEEVWNVFWYRGPDRPQPKDVKTRIEILHPGDEKGEGLVRTCTFAVPRWLGTGGVGRSWECVSEVRPNEYSRYEAVGKPLWSEASGWHRLHDLGDGRCRVEFGETYHAFNPVCRALFERSVHDFISRDNDRLIRSAVESGVERRRNRARES